MYRAYLVPDATQFQNRAAMYQAKLLMWDPRSESDAYAVIGTKFKNELNKAEGFEFTILPANIRYAQIRKKLSVVIVYDDNEWIFEGVVSDCPKDFYKQMKVTCAGPLSYLCDSVQAPDEQNSISIPTASGNTYVPVPSQWYNNANPHEQGWQERSYDENAGKYTYTLTSDTRPQNKTYYYVSSGDNQNHSGTTLTKKAATKETIQAHLERMLSVHNSQVDYFKAMYLDRCVGDSTEHEFKSSNYRQTWSAIKSDIIEQYGRYLTVKMDDNYTLKLNYLELRDMDSHSTPETSIVFTENMIEMSESDDSDDDIFTVLIPTGKNNLTISGVSGHDSPEHGDNRMVDPFITSWGDNKRYIIVSPYAVGRYGLIVKTQSFSDAGTADALWTSAVKYIKNNFDAHTEYEVKGIDKYLLGESSVRTIVGKKCHVKSGWHGVDEKDLYVISAEHDFMNPENDSYKIGIPTSDREAVNKTLTGQTTSSSTNSTNTGSNLSSGLNTIASWLETYFRENEGWLELHHKFRNEVEAENGMTKTRFEQDEEHINMMALKIFGVAGEDGVADQDAGWVLVPKPPYRKNGNGVEDYYEVSSGSNTTYKVPSEHNWYVKGSDGKYRLSDQNTRITQAQVDDPNVNFYIMRLANRYSELDVGPSGIKGRVDGNYQRSIASTSWISANENEILAITGHIHVTEDGTVIIDSGAGARTGYTQMEQTHTYVAVKRSNYSGNPSSKNWYERKLNSYGAWLGQDKADSATNDSYYILSTDTTANMNKYYYTLETLKESFVSEYGIYDAGNLTAGVMAQVINYPKYRPVPDNVKQMVYNSNGNPSALGWWEYDDKTGAYGESNDDHVDLSTDYYTVQNNMQSATDIWGEHIVIGRTDGYTGMDAATKAKVDKYIDEHNLDGTITEIASDVVVVNTLIAKYIDVDEITVGTMLSAEKAFISRIWVGMNAEREQIEDGEIVAIYGDFDWLAGGHVTATSLRFSPTGSGVGLGYDGGTDAGNGLARMGNPNDLVYGFGDPTYSGDDVTIPFTTLYDYCQNETDDTHKITFTKPASLGSVTWSSGSNTLTAKTVGGKDFLVGSFRNYVPSGQSEAMAMNSAGYLATETTGYSQVYGFYYNVKDLITGNTSERKVMVFKTPKNRYPDAVSTIRTRSSTGKLDGDDISLGVGGSSKIYSQYKTEKNFDDGVDTYESLTGINFYAPEIRMRATHNSTTYGNSETVPLGFGDSVDIKTQSKAHDAQDYSDYKTMKVTSPAKPTASGYTAASYKNVSYDDGDEITLDYSGSVKVYARFKLSDASNYTDCTGITVKSKADNSTSISTSDIDLGSVTRSADEPSADQKLTTLRDEINNAIANGNWVKFKVSVGSLASKTYKMDFT